MHSLKNIHIILYLNCNLNLRTNAECKYKKFNSHSTVMIKRKACNEINNNLQTRKNSLLQHFSYFIT